MPRLSKKKEKELRAALEAKNAELESHQNDFASHSAAVREALNKQTTSRHAARAIQEEVQAIAAQLPS